MKKSQVRDEEQLRLMSFWEFLRGELMLCKTMVEQKAIRGLLFDTDKAIKIINGESCGRNG